MRWKVIVFAMIWLSATPGQAGWYAEVTGNIQHRTGASDWVLFDGDGRQRDYVGQVTAVAGYEWRGLSVFAGWSHISLPEYGHDRGLNSQMVGISCRWRF